MYSHTRSLSTARPVCGLKGKKARAGFRMGGRGHMVGANAVHGELQHGLLRHFLQGTLGYVGLQVLEPFVGWHVPSVTAEARAAKLEDLRKHVENIDALPALELQIGRASCRERVCQYV